MFPLYRASVARSKNIITVEKEVRYFINLLHILQLNQYIKPDALFGRLLGRQRSSINTLVIAGVENNQDAAFLTGNSRIPIGGWLMNRV